MKNWHEDVFFGLHFDIHAGRDDQGLGSELTVEHLTEQLGKVSPDFVQCDCKGHPGYASYPTKVGVPSPGVKKDALLMWREATKRLGIPLAVHFSGVFDELAVKNNPEFARINKKSDGTLVKDTQHVCCLSDYTTTYMIPQMEEIIADYDVDGFWVDGENWATAPCYCERCQNEFATRNQDLAVPDSSEHPAWDAWLSFHRDIFVEHVQRYADAVHAKKPTCAVCSNWMYTLRQPDPIKAPVDYISGDFPWIWSVAHANAEARYMDGRGISWDLMAWGFTAYDKPGNWVFKSVPALCQEAAVVMACGGSFMVYDTPERTGPLIDWHMDRLREVRTFVGARQAYSQHTHAVPQAVILHSKRHFYHQNRSLFATGDRTEPMEGALHALLDLKIPTEIKTETDLWPCLDRYPLCVVPEQDALDEKTISGLIEYAKDGGCLLVTGTEQTRAFDDVSGVTDAGKSGQANAYIDDGVSVAPVLSPWRLVKTDSSRMQKPLLKSRRLFENAQPMEYPQMTVRRVGRGHIACLYGPVCRHYKQSHYPQFRNLLAQAIKAFDQHRLISVQGPLALQCALRQKNSRLFIHLINTGSSKMHAPNNAYVEDVPALTDIRIRLALDHPPKAVGLAPSFEPVDHTFADGYVDITVKRCGIHDIVTVDLSQ